MEVGNIFIKIGAKWDEVEKATAAVDKAMVKIGDKFQKVGKDLSIMGGAITAAMGLIIVKTANLGDQFYDLSQRTGIAVETLSSFKLAADKSGTSIGGFATGMKGLSRAMADAASGGKESKEAFDAVGVSATDSAGKLRPLDQVMLDVADRFAAMENGAEKNALALKLFGKSGMDLIPMLNLGRKGLEENIEQMKKFGIVTTEDARLGDAFNDAMTELQAATGGLTRVIGNALIPAMTSLATKAADIIAKVSAWAREHPLLIKVISGTVLGLGGLLTILGSVSYAIGTVLKHIPTLVNGFKVLVAGLKGIIALASKTIVFTFAIAGVAIVGAAVLKMIEDFKKLREAGESTAEALQNIFKNFNPFKSISREGLGKFLTDMEEARNKANDFKGVMILLGDAFRAIKSAIDPATSSLVSLAVIFKEFGLKTRTELTAELANATNALILLKTSAEATPGAIKVLEDKIKALKEGITGVTVETRSLAEQLGITFRADVEARIKKLNDALLQYRGKLTADEIQRIHEEINTLKEKLMALKGPVIDLDKAFQTLMDSMDNLPLTGEEVAADISDAFKDLRDEMQKDFEKLAMKDLPAYLQNIPVVSDKAAEETRQMWTETTDQMAKAFGEAFASILKDGLNFCNLMKSLVQGMVNAIATLVGKIMSKAFTDLFHNIATSSAGVFSGFSEEASTAAISIAAAFATIWIGIGVGMIESARQWDEYWDKVIEDARRAGEIIVETITSAMLRAGKAINSLDPSKRIGGLINPTEWQKAFRTIENAIKGVKTASEDLEDAWSKLLSEAKRLGKEGSKALIDLILAFRAAGKESKVLNEYMQSWLNTIPAALETLIAGIKKIGPEARDAGGDINGLGRIALLTFNSMIASGMSWIDAVNAMAGPLAALRDKYKELGMEADPALKRLFRIVGITQKHKELFEQIDATRQILIALGNSAWLTADAWKTLTGQAIGQFHQLRHEGLSVADSLRAMAPTLQAIVNYAATYGLQLDAQTQSLVNQAKKMGLIKDAQKDTGTVLVEGFNRVCDILIAIAKVLGADISGLMDDINIKVGTFYRKTEDVVTAWKLVEGVMVPFNESLEDAIALAKKLGIVVSEIGHDLVPFITAIGNGGGPAVTGGGRTGSNISRFASGGIAWTPQLARIAERGPEIIMPLREYRAEAAPSAGGRNGPVTVNIKPLLIDKKDHYLIEFIQDNFDHHVFRVPTAVVGG